MGLSAPANPALEPTAASPCRYYGLGGLDVAGFVLAWRLVGAFIQTSHDNDDFFLVTFNHCPSLTAEFSDGETLMRKLTSF